MEVRTPYENFLSIIDDLKGIPYFGCERPDGAINHGFRPLRGRLDEVTTIPEVIADDALSTILKQINAPDVGLFSVGCVSGPVDDSKGHRVSGYVEFAINDKRYVADAANYFPIFFHFTQRLKRTGFQDRVRFNWELMGASFIDGKCDGFSCSVVINTFFHSSASEAERCWRNALQHLGDHLFTIKDNGFDRLY